MLNADTQDHIIVNPILCCSLFLIYLFILYKKKFYCNFFFSRFSIAEQELCKVLYYINHGLFIPFVQQKKWYCKFVQKFCGGLEIGSRNSVNSWWLLCSNQKDLFLWSLAIMRDCYLHVYLNHSLNHIWFQSSCLEIFNCMLPHPI